MGKTDPHLLIAWHSRTGASQALAQAAASGAGERARLIACDRVAFDDFLAASGYLFVCPENLGTMSGLMKDMFDRCYYPVLGRIEGRGYATIIAAGSDGEGAQRQIDRIATGWRLRRIAEPAIVNLAAQTPEAILARKIVPPRDLAHARDLGAGFAAALEQGIF
ncbi:flavodoxin family protein [Altererythrobacter sp. H2]|uniref:flavodoxin family protein n=1 Tax=Altererythrobacter sp. H2 TaxID=3108391 RepID=UPI002B4C0ED8|nr:flavodoxin family protein [Altererythrobacter sp. H2]WRK94845.1 flavodoxin family protein [Altererythrobacter sp. H2]